MAYEDKPGDITIFKNDKATPENKQPEYNGTYINQDGEKCNVALWVRTAKQSGRKFFSGKIEFTPYNQEPVRNDPPSDDVPF